jgi:diacylglycerol kinase (ATP)
MRVLLLHNPTAGEGGTDRGELMEILEAEGFAATYQSTKEDFSSTLARPWELVIAAGGDGAVAEIAAALEGPHPPIAILPIGTANNLALSLGVRGRTREIVNRLRRPAIRRIRPLIASGPWGVRTLWEGAGVGLFPRVMRIGPEERVEADPDPPDDPPAGELHQALTLWARELAHADPIAVTASVDGRSTDGEFLMAEVPLVPLIGPNLHLVPSARPGDDRLHLLLVSERDREPLLAHLKARLAGDDAAAPRDLMVLSGRTIQLHWSHSAVRLDDEVWPEAADVDEDAGDESMEGWMTLDVGETERTVWVPGDTTSDGSAVADPP